MAVTREFCFLGIALLCLGAGTLVPTWGSTYTLTYAKCQPMLE